MVGSRTKGRIATWHRWLGLGLTVPLLGWIASSVAMTLVTLNAPNGLAGSYALNPYNSTDLRLDAATVTPTAVLGRLRSEYGIERLYSLRLQSRGPHLWYVAKPTPYALAMVFDARTGARLDPLPDSLMAIVAGEALVGGQVERIEPASEYNRFYAADRVPAVQASIAGTQPATLILSRDEGRTLRRLNGDSEQFTWWYRTFHVMQFTDHLALWTTLLYGLAAAVIALAVFGYQLFWWRRPGATVATAAPTLRVRLVHRTLGAAVGGILLVELVVGAYLWLNLGPLEDPFRGKASFNGEWNAGFTTQAVLADPAAVLARTATALVDGARPVQAIEWRRLGAQDAWLITPRLDEAPRVFAAATGAPITALPPDVAGEIARQEVVGRPSFVYVGPSPQLWTDLNRPVPTYRFRFDDPGNTDVYVAQSSGQIVQRRPFFWRLFEPFLAVHTFAFTGKQVVDLMVLALFQLAVLALIATGWRLQFPGRRATSDAAAAASSSGAVASGGRAREPRDIAGARA